MSNKLRQVIEHYGHELDSSNKMCCPFHNENTPSMVYYEDTDSHYCWGCGQSGNAINWICSEEGWDNHNGRDFIKAVEIYKDITGDVETYAPAKTIEQIEKEREDMALPFNQEVLAELKLKCSFDSKGYRGIRTDISKQFGCMYTYKEDGTVAETYYPTSQNSQNGRLNLSGFKVRIHPKDFRKHIGVTGTACELFNEWRCNAVDSNVLIITSAEHDTMALYQVLYDNTMAYNKKNNTTFKPANVVSSTVGEGSLAKQLQLRYDFINQFEKIIFCPDNDAAGKRTIEEVFAVVPKGKLFIMDLQLKDPNDYVMAGREKELVNAYFKAKKYVPTGVIGSSGLMDKVLERANEVRIPLPPFMKQLQKDMAGGIPLKTLINCGGGSGIGKSTIIDEIVYFWLFNSPYKIGILSLESDESEYGTKILSRHVSTKINLFDNTHDKLEFLNRPDIIKKAEELFRKEDGSDRFYLLEDIDGSVEDIKDSIMKMIIQMGCQFIIADPVQDVIAALTDAQQNEFMSWLKSVIKAYNVSFFLINHTRKEPNTGDLKEGKFLLDYVSEHDFHGSSSIYKSGHCNILMARNKEAVCEVEKNTTYVKASKIRWTGTTSRCSGRYYYDNKTHTLYDYDDYWTPERLREKESLEKKEQASSF